MTDEKKKYRETVAPFYKKDTGNFISTVVNQQTLDQLKKLKLGDKLLLAVRNSEIDSESTKPNAYLEIYEKSNPV